ncbi:MAG TPA: 2OG-Fe(II) oxygenase [Vicinamibacteria bacterium]|nr:2OG-Fe(II) oxygenase [Vicinamibacteria bacterium]
MALTADVRERLAAVDWRAVEESLRERPYATLPARLTPTECAPVAECWADPARFRSRVDMARLRFGIGEYRYFARPLPAVVEAVRRAAYPPLAAIANGWMEALRARERFPPGFDEFEARCWRAGQLQPTPLLLRYEAGGYNCLHQDLYGAVAFPLQLVVLLTRPGADHTGGELVLVQQRPRAQSVADVIAPGQGEMVVFANRHWPAVGSRGFQRTNVRHGVSRVLSGTRFALGVIFHDAA